MRALTITRCRSVGGTAVTRILGIITVGVLAVATTSTVLVLWAQWRRPTGVRLGDFQVYWAASGALLQGHDMYAARAPDSMQFTYPPFAGALLAALHTLPLVVVQAVWLAVVVAAGVLVPVLVIRHHPPGRFRWTAAGFGVLAFLASDSLRTSLHWGQVGMFLLTVVVVDALLLDRRRQGIGVGLVAAFRVSPAFIAVVALLRGRRNVALVAAVTAAVVSLLTALGLPTESWQYWTRSLWHTRRVGPLGQSNLSLLAVLDRAGLRGSILVGAWLLVAASLIVLVRRLPRPAEGSRIGLLRVLTAGGLLAESISPITWRHHWVWLPLAALLLYLDNRPRLAFGVAVVSALPFSTFAEHQRSGGWEQQVLFAVPVLVAVLVAFALLVAQSNERVKGSVQQATEGSVDRPQSPAAVRDARPAAARGRHPA